MNIETIEYKNHKINIVADQDSLNPRVDFDNLGQMVCFHSMYNLGDKHDYNLDSFHSANGLKQMICKDNDIAIILPLYLYDHSGITIQTTPFSCSFDSGLIGFVYVTKQAIRENFGVKKITKKTIEQATQSLICEVKTYDDYLTGNIYGYQVEGDLCEDSCYGFFGDFETSGLIEEAKSSIDYFTNEETKAIKFDQVYCAC